MSDSDDDRGLRTDWVLFLATIGTIALVCLPIVAFRGQAATVITAAYDALTRNLGILYLWYGVGTLAFLAWIAFGRYGGVRLGEPDSRPEFSTFSWVAMLFCAGVGATLLYWAIVEWGYYIDKPPYGFAPRSVVATEWAAGYGLFHWGFTGWAILCLPTIAIAYPYYVRRIPYLRLSTACTPFLPGGVNSARGRTLDFIYMLNLIGGSGTSLGLSTPMIAAAVAKLFGLGHDFVLEVVVMVACIAVFATSAWLGLERGFKRMSDATVVLAFAFLVFVLVVGPTLFILKMGTNSIGLVLQNFIRMNTWTDPVTNSGFVENWTIFYWAWWMAYGPFVGIFVTRISRGRTLREVVLGMLAFGSLGAAAFYVVLGNYAMHLELSGALDLTAMMAKGEEASAIANVVASLPFSQLALAVFVLVAVTLLATTYDSASYTLASVSTRRLEAGRNPARWHHLFWAAALGLTPLALMFVEGGLKVILSTTIVASLPLLAVGVLMAVSLVRLLREDAARTGIPP